MRKTILLVAALLRLPLLGQDYRTAVPTLPLSDNTVWCATCSKLCTYKVENNCTAATTPPDNSIGFINSGNYVGIATYVSWVSATGCIRFATSGPWTCSPALSFINSLNVVTPPYACTHNP